MLHLALAFAIGCFALALLLNLWRLATAPQITDRILVMYKGRLLAQGGIRDIRKQIDSHPHRITLTTDNPRKLAGALLLDDTVISARCSRLEMPFTSASPSPLLSIQVPGAAGFKVLLM